MIPGTDPEMWRNDRGARSFSLVWGECGEQGGGSVSLQKASEQGTLHAALFIHHAFLRSHFAYLARNYSHPRNIPEHCFLCFCFLPGAAAVLP